MDATNGIVKELKAENERLQKQLQEARDACDLYENELIALRQQIDETNTIARGFRVLHELDYTQSAYDYLTSGNAEVDFGFAKTFGMTERLYAAIQQANEQSVQPLDTEKHILPIISLIVDTATYYPDEDKPYMVESIVDPLYTVDSIQEAVERIIAEHPGRENIIKYNDDIIVNTVKTVASQVASHEAMYNMSVADGVTLDEVKQALDKKLNIASDDDTQEVDVEPISDAPYIAAWQGFIEELDNEDDS